MKIKNFFSRFFKKKEFVLTVAKPEKKIVSKTISKEEMTLKLIETLFKLALSNFPDFVDAGVVLDSRFNKIGYDAHAAFTIPNNNDPIFISISIDDIDECGTKKFKDFVFEKFVAKMKEIAAI